MKLHLPKQLFTALLAVFTLTATTPTAWGLTVTTSEHKTFSLQENYTGVVGGVSFSYDTTTGILTGYNVGNGITLSMKTSWEGDSRQNLIVTGLNTNNQIHSASFGLSVKDGWLGGYWDNAYRSTSQVTESTLAAYGDTASFWVNLGNSTGTFMYMPESREANDKLINDTALKASGADTTRTYLNKNLIEYVVVGGADNANSNTYYVSNYTGSWSQTFNKSETTWVKNGVTELSTLTPTTHILVGNTGQLLLDASTAELTVDEGSASNIYVGKTTQAYSDTSYRAAMRFDNTNAISIGSNIYVVDDTTLLATGTAAINFTGAVTDKAPTSEGNGTIATGSTLTLVGQGYQFTNNVDVSRLVVEAGASASFNGSTVISAITNNGSITNNGTMVLSSTMEGTGTVTNGAQGRIELGAYTLNRFDDVTYTDGDSGFVNTLTVFGENVSYTEDVYVGGSSCEVNNGSIALNGADTTYYVNETSHTVSDTDATKASAFYINTGASLNKVSNSTAKLAGSGTYVLGTVAKHSADGYVSTAVLGSLSLDQSNWTGTVEISGESEVINFNDLGQAGSTVKIQAGGLKGFLLPSNKDVTQAEQYKYTPHIELDGDLTINDGYEGHHYIFLGDISGTGSLKKTVQAGNDQRYHFRGDLSNWTGSITNTVSTRTHVYLEGNAHTVGASINKGSGELHLTVATDAAATLKNTVTVNTLTLNQNATFNSSVTASTVSVSRDAHFKGGLTADTQLNVTGGTLEHSVGTSTLAATSLSGGTLKMTSGSLTHSGIFTQTGGTLQLNGGDVTFNGRLNGTGGTVNMMGGNIAINHTDATNVLNVLDIAGNNFSTAQVSLASTAVLQVKSTMWLGNTAAIKLADDAKLIKGNMTIIGTGNESSVTRLSTGNDNTFKIDSVCHAVTNAEMEMNMSSAGTLKLQLVDTAVTNIGAGELTVSNSGNTITQLSANGGNVKLSESMSVESISAKAGKVVTVASGKTISMAGGVSLSASGADATMTAKSDSALARLQKDASFTIADMTLTNTTITAATAETHVNLNNVSASNLALATGKFTMNAAPVVGLGGGTDATFNTGVSSLTAGAATLTLDLDMIGAYESTGAVSGATLTITLGVSGADFSSYTVENWQALVGFDQESWLGEALVDATFTTEAVAAPAEAGSAAPTVSYGYTAGDGGSNVGMLTITINGLNVPEPTTATLSLLALAALAARRRRK